MLFKRRNPPTLLERTRTWVWPRRSWARSLRYFLLRLERLQASPHQVALGCAAGVFVSITPLLGTQMLLAALLAFSIRASIPAALIGTFFGNPLSWPLIWAGTYFAGCYMLGIESVLTMSGLEHYMAPLFQALGSWSPELIDTTIKLVWPVLKPMLAGSVPLGLATAILIYYVLRPLVATYQRSRVGLPLSASPAV
ncbi:MAG: DUF2062 domain-containing protein [Alphaproteobacteria bacterium]|nr:DUF2062 domain-containing protein [Alphaproteobacteria bacterium]